MFNIFLMDVINLIAVVFLFVFFVLSLSPAFLPAISTLWLCASFSSYLLSSYLLDYQVSKTYFQSMLYIYQISLRPVICIFTSKLFILIFILFYYDSFSGMKYPMNSLNLWNQNCLKQLYILPMDQKLFWLGCVLG